MPNPRCFSAFLGISLTASWVRFNRNLVMTETEIFETFGDTLRTVLRWRKDRLAPVEAELITRINSRTHGWPCFKIQDGVMHKPNRFCLTGHEIQPAPWIIASYRTLFVSTACK